MEREEHQVLSSVLRRHTNARATVGAVTVWAGHFLRRELLGKHAPLVLEVNRSTLGRLGSAKKQEACEQRSGSGQRQPQRQPQKGQGQAP